MPDKESQDLLQLDSQIDKVINQDNEVETVPFHIIPVIFTFIGYEPMKFYFKRQLSAALKASKQAFYDLKEEERKDKVFDYRIDSLTALLDSKPINVPEFPEGDDYRKSFRTFFSREENEELLEWIWGQYQQKLYPKELM